MFRVSYTGFIRTDTEALLDSPPAVSTSADPLSSPGEYPIMLTGGIDNNYHFILLAGSLSVLPRRDIPDVHLVSPADGATEVAIPSSMLASPISQASLYTIQVSTDVNFTTYIEKDGGRRQSFGNLTYNTPYFVRVRTNLSSIFGPISQFSTGRPEKFSFLKSPTMHSVGVDLSPRLTCSHVTGARTYTIEVNMAPDFSGLGWLQTGPRSQRFNGLALSTTYYVRVKTDLSDVWGPTRLFITGSPPELDFVKWPSNGAKNVSWLPTITVNSIGAAAYTLQISELADFGQVIELTRTSDEFVITSSLAYNTRYFTRVKSNLSGDSWGPVRSFTTGAPPFFSFVKSPKNGEENVNYQATIACNLVPGATSYTVSLSTDTAFTSVAEIQNTSSGRRIQVTLSPATMYYCRVRTNLSDAWGAVGKFTTGNPLSLSYITRPMSGAVQVNVETVVSAQYISGASIYTIELNTNSDFTGFPLVKSALTNRFRFVLSYNTTYYARVKTDLNADLWGVTRHFSTIDSAKQHPVARLSLAGKQDPESGEDQVVREESQDVWSCDLRGYPNPFTNTFALMGNTTEKKKLFLRIAGEVDLSTQLQLGADWTPGVYIIYCLGKERNEVIKVMKR